MTLRRLAAALAALQAVALPVQAQAGGDPLAGREQYESRCTGCHSVDENRVGPAHRGVYGRRAGTAPGFNYSSALRASGVVWNDKSLDAWLANPEKFIPGQAMFFLVDDARVRGDIVAYLATLKP
jgi:cytochrome c